MRAEDRAALAQLAAADSERARQLGDAWIRAMRCGDFRARVALHIFHRGAGLHESPDRLGIASGADDLLHAAQRIAALDLLISIDSMPAHLAERWVWRRGPAAGAGGLALDGAADRQPVVSADAAVPAGTGGEWQRVIERVAAQLAEVAARKR